MTRKSNNKVKIQTIYHELKRLAVELNYNLDAVIVEGIHDQKTLRRLGYHKSIITCSKQSLKTLVEDIAQTHVNVLVLTDFDDEGKAMNTQLTMLFKEKGINVDQYYRERFYTLLNKAQIRTVEGIYRLQLEQG